jgi:putative glycosyltransferase
MRLSIVTTLYKSAPFVNEFYRRTSEAARRVTDDYEIIMVDDGSPDNSLEIACAIVRSDPKLRVVELSRNFGHHKALMTGLDHAGGEFCFLIDSDLEEDPAILDAFFEKMRAEDADVVFGYQTERKGGIVERLTGDIAYRMFSLLLSHPIPRNAATVRLMKREYVDSLLLHRERQTVIGGLWVLAGYRQIGVPIKKATNPNSSYGFWRRWRALVDSVTAFSETPLIGIFYLGLLISSLSGVVGVGLLVHKFIYRGLIEGWVSVMISLWFLGGILIFCVGIIGIYISKIFIETKNRPYTIVRRMHGNLRAHVDSSLTSGVIDSHRSRQEMRRQDGND